MSSQTSMLHRLPWDSEHFGFPVARIQPPTLSARDLEQSLGSARQQGYALVYWAAELDHPVSGSLLSEYCGALVDRKTVFSAELHRLVANRGTDLPTGVEVAEYPAGEACPELVALGIAAGSCCRFFRDPRVPRDAARRLYAIWTEKSARRELADVLFVARERGAPGPLAGMVSCARRSQTGSIGLIAVEGSFRARGIGTALLAAAHRWMVESGAVRADVVTQRENAAACGLYERCGYAIRLVQDYYHFWPTASSPR